MKKQEKQATAEFKWARRAVILNGALVLAGWILMLRFELDEHLSLLITQTTGIGLYSVLALLIIRRHPRHPIGRLFLLTGGIGSLFVFNGAGLFSWGEHWTSELALQIITWFDLQLGPPWFMIPISLVVLYFPDGKLPSPRWKIVRVMVWIGILYTQATMAFGPWTGEMRGPFDADNPLEISGSQVIMEGPVGAVLGILTLAAILGCLVSVLVRFRRSRGVERVQMKWLVYSAAVIIGMMFLLLIFGVDKSQPEIMWGFTLIAPVLLALAVGLAILRFRLFDIDIIIRRTLQYTLLTGTLALVYFGLVILLQNIFSTFSEQQSPVIIVLSTLAIAALFNPLRTRIQDFIDRRFFRKKYDAELALAKFSNTARDGVDVDRLSVELMALISETMQPEQTSLWIRKP